MEGGWGLGVKGVNSYIMSEKMNISMISFGPVESKSNGYFIRCYRIARSLTKFNHEVLVMQFPHEKSSNFTKCYAGIRFVNLKGNEIRQNRVSRMLKNVLTFDPFHSLKFQLCSLIELFRSRDYLKNCDLVFAEGALIPVGLILPKMFKKKVILDTHCLNKLLALHFRDRNFLVYFVRKTLWDLLERLATSLSDIIIVVSKSEKEFVEKEYRIPESKIYVVPNVIEMERRYYSKAKLASLRKKWNLEDKIIITFVGDLKSVQNEDAVKYIVNELASLFWEKRNDVVFLIIGRGNENFRCTLPNVVFTGFVKDLPLFLAISDVCIAPLRVGAGTKTKVLEYKAYGKRVITTPIGVEGIEMFGNEQSVTVTEIETFPEKLLKTIENLNYLQNAGHPNVVNVYTLYSKLCMEQNLNELLQVVGRAMCQE